MYEIETFLQMGFEEKGVSFPFNLFFFHFENRL